MPRTITLNSSRTWPDVKNDYVLHSDGHLIGRIRFSDSFWQWHINIPMALPVWAEGTTDNLADARKALAVAWGRLLSETSSERLELAWAIERGAEARLQRAEAATPTVAEEAPTADSV